MKRSILLVFPALAALAVAAGVRVSVVCAQAEPSRAASAPDAGAPLSPAARDRLALRQALDAAIAIEPLAGSRFGVHVLSIATGETVYAHNADELLNPASNVKLVTAAAALARLGPEYRFSTEFLCVAGAKRDNCPVLWIRGRGDPALNTERLHAIASELFHRGLRKVGDVCVDDTYFDAEREGPGWDQERSDKAYLAPAGALALNHDAAGIYVTPGEAEKARARVEVEPPSEYFKIENQVVTVSKRSRQRLVPASIADGDHQRIVVSGRLRAGGETVAFWKRIDNPPMYAGETFKAVLRQHGVEVKGRVKAGTVPEDAVVLHASWSPELAEIVRDLNKQSNNFIAEQLLKTLGAEAKGPPGTWIKGVEAVESWLAETGIPRGTYVMKNGSGLNDTNRFSAAQMTRLLAAVHERTEFFPEYAASLGIAARDGTVRLRMEGTPAAGRLRAKTGTLENAAALSGYVRTPAGELLAYSILVNDYVGPHRGAVAGIDRVAETVAAGGREAVAPPVVARAEPGPMEELRARVSTYAGLARLADKRSLPFLRSALRAEADPVLRAVLADAAYRSDPEAGIALLLDNVPRSPDVLGRLRTVARELSVPVPSLNPLIDLAAEGNAEALDRLLSLSASASEDDATATLVADGLQEIGRTAPSELFDALVRSPQGVSAAALPLLAKGIAAAADKAEHPFLATLRRFPEGNKARPAAMTLFDAIQKALADIAKAAACEGAACERKGAPGGGGD